MKLFRKIVLFDFETSGNDPFDPTNDIVQIAAVAIDPNKLEIMPDTTFEIDVRPPDIDNPEYMEAHRSTVEFHMQNQRCTLEDLRERWKAGTKEKTAWNKFRDYCQQFAKDNKFFSMPNPAGKNIINYDLPICSRMNQKYQIKEFFFRRDAIDLDQLCLYWFMYHFDAPERYNMDTLRPYFGLSSEKAHDALFDVKQEADLIIKFLGLHKKLSNNINFRDCFLRK